MKHRNPKNEEWTNMAIDSRFDRGKPEDWKEFASALKHDRQIALDAVYMSNHHVERGAAELALVLVRHFYGNGDLALD